MIRCTYYRRLVTKQIPDLPTVDEVSDCYFVECASARLREIEGDYSAAVNCFRAALTQSIAEHEKKLLQRKLVAIQERLRDV